MPALTEAASRQEDDQSLPASAPVEPVSKSLPPPQPAVAHGAESAGVPFRWFILLGLITSAIMEVLDTTIVNVSLPQMGGNLGATYQEVAWVSTGYILSNVVVLPMTAFLTARFGRKRYLSFSILLFIVASFFCGTSHTLGELVFWRVMQGAGGAALLSTAQATLRQVFPKEEQAVVQSLFLLGIIVAPTLGPTLGGWITDNYTWNWCFFINVPIGILSVFLVTTFLHDPPTPPARGKVDWTGISLLAVGLASLQYVLEQGNEADWFNDAWITRLTVLSGICLTAMMFWELSPRNGSPVVNFRVLKNRELGSSIFIFIALGFGNYGGTYLFPLFTQTILGFTPTQTGLSLLPGGLAVAVSTIFCGRLLGNPKRSVDPRYLLYIGASLFLYSMWKLAHLTPQSGESDTQLALLIRGFGMGLMYTPINNAAFGNLKPSEAQQASGLINLSRQIGGSFGIAILGTYVTNKAQFHRVNMLPHIYNGNTALMAREQGIAASLVHHGYSATQAHGVSLGLINQIVTRQAQTMSYNDGFLLILTVFACVSPFMLLLRKPGAGATGAPADAH